MPSEAISGSHPVMRDLLQALGLDSNGIRKFSLQAHPDDVIVTTSEKIVIAGQIEAVAEIVRTYRLVLEETVVTEECGEAEASAKPQEL